MLNLKEMKNIINRSIGEMRDSIIRQVNSKEADTNIDYEKNKIVWYISELQIIDRLLTHQEEIKIEAWEKEIAKLDLLQMFLHYE